MHTISGVLEMLRFPNLGDEKKEQYMATAQKQIERVVRLFEDIKSLQRYDYDQSFIKKSVFDVRLLVKGSRKNLYTNFRGKGSGFDC